MNPSIIFASVLKSQKSNQIQGLTFAATRVIDRTFLEIKRKGIMIE